MRRLRRDHTESGRESVTPVARRNLRPRRRDHIVAAWSGFGAITATAVGASIGVSVNELLTKGPSLGVVGVGFGALVGAVGGDVVRRSSSGLASYRKARKEYLTGTGGPAVVGGTIRDVKTDLRLAQDKAQQGIDRYMSARSLFEEALTVAAAAMDGSTHADAEESQRGLNAAISAIRTAITKAENGRDGYGKLAEQM